MGIALIEVSSPKSQKPNNLDRYGIHSPGYNHSFKNYDLKGEKVLFIGL
jgi:hypothetical protein